MLPSKPVKKYGLGLRVSSTANKSFNWLEWANPNTFETEAEANEYMTNSPEWNNHRNQNNAGVKNKYCGIIRLSQEEIDWWNSVVP